MRRGKVGIVHTPPYRKKWWSTCTSPTAGGTHAGRPADDLERVQQVPLRPNLMDCRVVQGGILRSVGEDRHLPERSEGLDHLEGVPSDPAVVGRVRGNDQYGQTAHDHRFGRAQRAGRRRSRTIVDIPVRPRHYREPKDYLWRGGPHRRESGPRGGPSRRRQEVHDGIRHLPHGTPPIGRVRSGPGSRCPSPRGCPSRST